MELDKNTKNELIKIFKNNDFIKVELEITRLLYKSKRLFIAWNEFCEFKEK